MPTGSQCYYMTTYVILVISMSLGLSLLSQAEFAETGSCCVPSNGCPAARYEEWMLSSEDHRPRGATPLFGMCVFTEQDEKEIGCPFLANMSTNCMLESSTNCLIETTRPDATNGDTYALKYAWSAIGILLITGSTAMIFLMLCTRSCRRAPRDECRCTAALFAIIIVAVLLPIMIISIVAATDTSVPELGERVYLSDTKYCVRWWPSSSGSSQSCRETREATFRPLSDYGGGNNRTASGATVVFNDDAGACPFGTGNQTAHSLRYVLLPWETTSAWIVLHVFSTVLFLIFSPIITRSCCSCDCHFAMFSERLDEWEADIRDGI
jgi:hypothetical protein